MAGTWPGVAASAGRADLVVCHHVLHDVVDLPPFPVALTAAAGRGVVVEVSAEHPPARLYPLRARFHGLRRPPPAAADDAVAVLAEPGVRPAVTRWHRETPPRHGPGGPTAVPAAGAVGRGRRGAGGAARAPARVATLVWQP